MILKLSKINKKLFVKDIFLKHKELHVITLNTEKCA